MQLQIFEKKNFKIRGFMVDDEPYFVARDIAEALGYDLKRKGTKNYDPTGTMLQIVDKEDVFTQKSLTVSKTDVRDLGLHPSIKLVSESGMYSAIFGSQLESAKEFKRWVTKEVLPSIRKTGSYSIAPKLPDFTNPAEAARAWATEYEAKIEAQKQRDKLIHDSKTYTTSQIAGELGFKSAIEFNKQLHKDKIIYKQNGTWIPYATYRDKNFMITKQQELDNGKIIYYSRWTGSGRDFLLGKYQDRYQSVLEQKRIIEAFLKIGKEQ